MLRRCALLSQRSFIGYGGSGPTLLALHGHFGSARAFASLAAQLTSRVRVIAMDQRGHGVTAYQLAARRPELVRGLVVEDAPALVEPPIFDRLVFSS